MRWFVLQACTFGQTYMLTTCTDIASWTSITLHTCTCSTSLSSIVYSHMTFVPNESRKGSININFVYTVTSQVLNTLKQALEGQNFNCIHAPKVIVVCKHDPDGIHWLHIFTAK